MGFNNSQGTEVSTCDPREHVLSVTVAEGTKNKGRTFLNCRSPRHRTLRTIYQKVSSGGW